MNNALQDPYNLVRDAVQLAVTNLGTKAEELRQAQEVDRCRELKKSLKQDVKSADRQLRELQATVDHVASNRSKFPHIEDSELEERAEFVDAMQRRVAEAKRTLEDPEIKRRLAQGEAKTVEMQQNMGATNAREMDNTRFVGSQRQTAQETMRKQDADLGELEQGLDRLNRVGKDIHGELVEHNRMLDDLENELDDAGTRMNFVMAKLEKLLKTKDRCQIWTIVALTLILVLLVVLTIYL